MRPIGTASFITAMRSHCWSSAGDDDAWPEPALAARRDTLCVVRSGTIRQFVDVITRVLSARCIMRALDRRPLRHQHPPKML
jgi:hypothetical protein